MRDYKDEIKFGMKRKDYIFYNEFYRIRGQLKHALYHIKDKCYNKANPFYKHYGKKGIEVCSSWTNDFNSFLGWALNNNYIIGMQIHRLNIHKDYTPENCIICTPERYENMYQDAQYSDDDLIAIHEFLENFREDLE